MGTRIQNKTVSTLSSKTYYLNCDIKGLDINASNKIFRSGILFDNCRFLSPIYGYHFSQTVFRSNCTFAVPVFQDCIWNDVKIFTIPNLQCIRCQISNTNLSFLDLSSSQFTSSNLTTCTFDQLNLSNAKFSSLTLNNCRFTNSNLSYIDLSSCTFNSCGLSNVNLCFAKFVLCTLAKSTLNSSNLSNAVLTSCNLISCTLNNIDLSNAILTNINSIQISGSEIKLPPYWKLVSGVFIPTRIENTLVSTLNSKYYYYNCDISGLDIYTSKIDVSEVIFDNCRFLNPIINHQFFKTEFKSNCSFAVPLFQDCILNDVKMFSIPDLQCIRTQITDTNLSFLDLSSSKFTSSNLTRCTFDHLNLSNTKFSSSTFNNCNLTDSNLSYIDLSSCTLNSCTLSDSNLSIADLSSCTLNSCTLSDVNLSHAKFSSSTFNNCTLSDSNLSIADLSSCTLNTSTLSDVNLSHAVLTSCNLISCTLTNLDLSNAILTNIYSIEISGSEIKLPAYWKLMSGVFILTRIENTLVSTLNSKYYYFNCDISGLDIQSDQINVVTEAIFDNCRFLSPIFNYQFNQPDFKSNCSFTFPLFQDCILNNIKIFSIPNLQCIQCQISDTNLSFLDLSSANFSFSSLISSDLTNLNLSNAILTDLYSRENFGNAIQLPEEWKIISGSLVGPQANLDSIVLTNVNLDQMNLYGVNLTNATLDNVSIQDTIFLKAVFNGLISSRITGVPAVLPIGSWIENNRIQYKQDNIIVSNPVANILNQVRIIQSDVSSSKVLVGDSGQNFIFGGICDNKIFGVSVPTYNNSNPLFVSNKIHIYDDSNFQLIKKIELTNFHIRSFRVQSLLGGGFALMGYGVNTGLGQNKINPNDNPVQIFTVLLDSSGNLNSFFENNGTKKFSLGINSKLLGENPNFILNQQKFYLSSLDISSNPNSFHNQWEIKCKDSSGVDFSGKNLSYLDLSGIQFTNCQFTKTNLSYCNLTNAKLINCTFNQTNFTGSDLTNVDLTGSIFIKPIFANIKIAVSNENFTLGGGYKIINGIVLGPNMNLDGLNLSGYNLNNINLSGSTLIGTRITNCQIAGTNFNQCILDNLISGGLTGTPLRLSPYRIVSGFIVGSKVNLLSADLSGGDLSNLDLSGILVDSSTNMFGCNFIGSKTNNIRGLSPILISSHKMINGNILAPGVLLPNTDLSNSNIDSVDLSGADLTNVNFYRTQSNQIKGIPQLSSSYFIENGMIIGPGVDLSQKDLSGIIIESISLKNCNLSQTDMRFSFLRNIGSGNIEGIPLLPSSWKIVGGFLLGPLADLSGENLSGLNLSLTSLNGANLFQANLKNIKSGGIQGIPILPTGYRMLNGYLVGSQVDLSGADLEYQDLSDLDLFETNLSNAKLNYAILTRCFLFQTNLNQIEFKRIVSGGLLGNPRNLPQVLTIQNLYSNQGLSRFLVGPDLNLSNIEFRNLNLENLDLSGCLLNNSFFNQTNLSQTNLTNCNLNGIRSYGVIGNPIFPDDTWRMRNGFMIGPYANLTFQDFTNLDLSGTNLSNTNLNQVKFSMTRSGPFNGFPLINEKYIVITIQNKNYLIGSGINLENMDLSGIDLSLLNLSNTHLQNTKLVHTKLNKVSSGSITGIPYNLPKDFKLEGGYLLGPTVNLSFANLERLILSDTNFTEVNFKGANIKNSIIDNVILDRVVSGNMIGLPFELDSKYRVVNGYFVGGNMNLENVDLSGVNLSGINLSGTSFKGSNLTNVNFTNSILTNSIFIGSNLTGVIPTSILDNLDLTGAILPLNNYSQFNRIISDQLTRSELNRIYYFQVKERVLNKLFVNSEPRDDLLLSTIKLIHYPTYLKLHQLYTILGNGLDYDLVFDQLSLKEIDLRFQVNAKILTLIQNINFSDELLCRVLNRIDIETIPENMMKILNINLVSLPTLVRFYMKHLFNEKFQNYILMIHPILLPKIETFFRKWSKIYQNNHFVKKLYGVNNNYIQSDYQKLYQMYPKQMEIFEMYMFSEDILNQYTNAEEVYDLFQEIVLYNPNGFTPMVKNLFTKIGTKIFSICDKSIIFRMNRFEIYIDYHFELDIMNAFIRNNSILVENIFENDSKLKLIWLELNKNEPDIYVIQNLGFSGILNIDTAMIQFRTILFYYLKQITYSNVYTEDITKTLLDLKDGKLDSLNQLSETNLEFILDYIKENPYVEKITENPDQFIQDLKSDDFSKVKDLSKFYGMDYLNASQKEKIIEMDIHQKLQENELYYIRLFSGSSNDPSSQQRLIAPLIEYRKIWNKMMYE